MKAFLKKMLTETSMAVWGKRDSRASPGLIKMITEHVIWIYITLMASGTGGCDANGLSLVMLVLSRMTNGYATLSL